MTGSAFNKHAITTLMYIHMTGVPSRNVADLNTLRTLLKWMFEVLKLSLPL